MANIYQFLWVIYYKQLNNTSPFRNKYAILIIPLVINIVIFFPLLCNIYYGGNSHYIT